MPGYFVHCIKFYNLKIYILCGEKGYDWGVADVDITIINGVNNILDLSKVHTLWTSTAIRLYGHV